MSTTQITALIRCHFCKAQTTNINAMIWHVKRRHYLPNLRKGVPVDVLLWLAEFTHKEYYTEGGEL